MQILDGSRFIFQKARRLQEFETLWTTMQEAEKYCRRDHQRPCVCNPDLDSVPAVLISTLEVLCLDRLENNRAGTGGRYSRLKQSCLHSSSLPSRPQGNDLAVVREWKRDEGGSWAATSRLLWFQPPQSETDGQTQIMEEEIVCNRW